MRTLEQGEGLILIIDDEELIRNTASEILSESGYEILTAENGQEGSKSFVNIMKKLICSCRSSPARKPTMP